MTRALGRPIRDQVTSVRATQPTTPQALELVNGELLTSWLLFGARKMLGVQGTEPLSLYNKSVAGRTARPVPFDVDIAGAVAIVAARSRSGIEHAGAGATGLGAGGVRERRWHERPLLGAMRPADTGGLRPGTGPMALNGAPVPALRVSNPSTLVYDIAGRGFTRLRGVIWIENPVADVGSTLDPQLRFYVFDTEPNMDRLRPPMPGTPLPLRRRRSDRRRRSSIACSSPCSAGAPSPAERQAAENAVQDPQRPGIRRPRAWPICCGQ